MPRSTEKVQFDSLSSEELLNTAVDTIADPSLVPPGRWIMRCTTAKILLPKEGDTFKYAYFLVHTPVQAIEADATLVEDGQWRGASIMTRRQIASAKDNQYANAMFEAHGISVDGRGPKALVEVVKNLYVDATVDTRSYDRKTQGGGKETVTENVIKGWHRTDFHPERQAA